MTVSVANFGVGPHPRSRYDGTDPQLVLGRVLFGFEEERDRPWITYEPSAIPDVRRDLRRAIERAAALEASDEYMDWFGSQLRLAERVFAHAVDRRQWVVSVFEGGVSCFLTGGEAHWEKDDGVFGPHCTPGSRRAPVPRFIPLGVTAVLVAGLAVAGWRQRRFLRRLSGA